MLWAILNFGGGFQFQQNWGKKPQSFRWRESCMNTGMGAGVAAGRVSWPLRREWGRDAQCLIPDSWMWGTSCGYQMFIFRAGRNKYGRNKKHSEEASGERRNYFFKYVLYWALTWFCLELNQSKFRNVGFLRCGVCCCSFPGF